ncbi:hypothetical protein IJE86_11000 [bacterium]|nr:hypothetical protein [bacterium]
MANIYDKKKEERINKELRKYEIRDKIINAVNPLKIIGDVSDATEKVFDKIGGALDSITKKIDKENK